jgi:putative tricarboxylic transport membrane protein
MLPTFGEMKMLIPTIIRSSLIGIGTGILPGAGGNIGSWVSYDIGQKFAKDKTIYGKGSLEGVCASETANNAVTGGALIPMMTLGIPGSAAAAIILGGLMIQGLQPGSKLFVDQAPIAYSIILGFLISNIMIALVGLTIAKYVVKVTQVPVGVLTPIVCVLAIVGSYAINSNVFNIFVMGFFGLAGYFLIKADYSPPAIVLGLILGRMAETGFRQSLVMSRGNLLGYYFTRPISVGLIVLIIIALAFPILRILMNKRIVSKSNNGIS